MTGGKVVTSDKDRSNRVIEIYEVTVGVQNIVNEIQKLDENYFRNNWSLGLSNLSYDLEYILNAMLEAGFSLDYKQAITFMSYVKIFDFLVNKMKDDLTVYEEGIGFIKLIIKNLNSAVKPFVAFVCSRVRDLNLVNKISPALLGVYRKYEEEGIDKIKELDLSNIFDFAFPDDEDMYDDIYIEEAKEEISQMFGDSYDLSDFESISSILYEYNQKHAAKSAVQLDF